MVRLSAFQTMRLSSGTPCLRAIGLEAVDDLRVGPVEEVDAERGLALGKRMRHGDEEAPLEGADLHHGPRHPHLSLHAHEPAADGSGEARGHAGHAGVAGLQVAVDGGMPDRTEALQEGERGASDMRCYDPLIERGGP